MKLLLYENLPKKLKTDFPEHEIYTVTDKGWNGVKNGELLKLLIKEGFDALLTFDKNLQHQQNFNKYTIAVLVLMAPINTHAVLTKLVPQIKDHLKKGISAGPTIISL